MGIPCIITAVPFKAKSVYQRQSNSQLTISRQKNRMRMPCLWSILTLLESFSPTKSCIYRTLRATLVFNKRSMSKADYENKN